MRRKALFIIGILVCIVIIGFGIVYFSYIAPANKVLKTVRNMEIKDIDLSTVSDGKYIGEFSYNNSYCKVEVHVSDHTIRDIEILDNSKSEHGKKAEVVINEVIDSQRTNVDAITGATTTSKALLKAVESALTSGLE